jgi:DNA (cytosine-5)-methyltransferase 1
MKPSDVTVTDLFCGAGGSSIGAAAVGARLRLGLNHWKLAIETHNTNFPDADHDCTDVSQCDPRRYPSTNILIASPECTNHSLAKGKKRKGQGQPDLFVREADDPAAVRSRATMWDVPRFAEFHDYDLVIVENVIDARHWVLWDAWLKAMDCLGYLHRCVYLNSMFCHPTPQSRDRMYIVFWKRGNRAPDLEFRPRAFCGSCDADVEAVQSWKSGRTAGRYRRQYVFCCPRCAGEVTPYYFAALNAIDWTVPAERISDRARPLKERTIARIQYGLEKYGRRPLVVRTNMTSGVECRVRDAGAAPMDTQPGSNITALVAPWLVDTAFGQRDEKAATGAGDPMSTQTTRQTQGVAMPPSFVLTYRNYEGVGYPVRGLDAPLGTIVTSLQDRLVINGAAVVNLRDWRKAEHLTEPLDSPLPTQITAPQTAIASRTPFLVSYYGNDIASSAVADPVGTVTGTDRHALVQPDEEMAVEDCYFRMLQPHEIGAGMAFPADYTVLGNKRDRVKQLGNAVTPPAMRWLMERAIASLEAA